MEKTSAGSDEKQLKYESEPAHAQVVPPAQQGNPELVRKLSISAYMTIAAAAFGLISDGCEWLLLGVVDPEIEQVSDLIAPNSADQNNLMTMANVSQIQVLSFESQPSSHWALLGVMFRSCSKNCTLTTTHQRYQLGYQTLCLSVRTPHFRRQSNADMS